MHLCKILCASTALLLLQAQLLVASQVPVPVPVTETSETSVRGLRYDYYRNLLYFCDPVEKTIHIYDLQAQTDKVLQLNQSPAFVIQIKDMDYLFVVGLDRDLVILFWDYDSKPDSKQGSKKIYYTYFTCLLATVDSCCRGNRWNSAQVDHYGNLYGGMMTDLDPPDCTTCPPALYRALLTKQGQLTPDVAIQSFYSTGIVFTVDNRVMYTIDYYNRQIYSFNYDLPRTLISCPKVVFRYDDFNLAGFPYSITIDTDGNLWIGSYNGSQVVQVNPNTGEMLQTIDFPTALISSVAFGDKNLNVLFVGSTASGDPLDTFGGDLFAVLGLGVNGVVEVEAAVNSICRPFYF